jgi:hypothetical protein
MLRASHDRKATLVPAMRNTEKNGSREEIAMRLRLRTWRWIRRLDMAVASALLLLLILGWVVRWAPAELWPRGEVPAVSRSSHAWSGDSLR